MKLKLKLCVVNSIKKIKNCYENFKFRNKFENILKYFTKFKVLDFKKFYVILKDVTRHFCFNTSLHGYRFIALKNISVTER